ncbi:hypothetical protein MLD38_037638 [Melastoma candidum]|uniref:Uncharacterized protein n=1 Tax=Melastoma candidum TaxID=119954 RepID=A0ACB9LPA7_9MYRT|nr:hypothetical protein MLD38_037638 [Melastoma candidum]
MLKSSGIAASQPQQEYCWLTVASSGRTDRSLESRGRVTNHAVKVYLIVHGLFNALSFLRLLWAFFNNIYTIWIANSFARLFPLLLSGALPLVKVEEISHTIDLENLTIQNCVQFSGPLPATSLITNTKFEVCRSKKVQVVSSFSLWLNRIKLEEGVTGTPQPTDSIVVHENVEFFWTTYRAHPFKGIITSVHDTASSVIRTISNQQ